MKIKNLLEGIKAWQVLIGVIGSIVLIVTTAFAVDGYFAKDKAFQLLALNFEQYKVEESIDRTQDRIYETQDRIKKEGEKPELVEKLRELQDRKCKLEKKLDVLEKEEQSKK